MEYGRGDVPSSGREQGQGCALQRLRPPEGGIAMYREEHAIFRDAFKKHIVREIVPNLDAWESDGIIPREAWEKMGASGFLCPWLPEVYGGSGADFLYSVIIAEELAKA